MIIRQGKKRALGLDEPLLHAAHKKPVTRRDFLAQGLIAGSGTFIAPALLGMLANPRIANALSNDIDLLRSGLCDIKQGAGRVPFMCFDLAGGANLAGSNILAGGQGGQLDFLTSAGYAKLGLPGDRLPNNSQTNFVDARMGARFHSQSAFLAGMVSRMQPSTMANVNGVAIPARSENDTGNNPHNPMYGIAKTGSYGGINALIGSQSSDSGGNSMAPLAMIDAKIRPTKVDRRSDAVALVDTGELATLLPSVADTVSVMESMSRTSEYKLGRVSTGLSGSGDADSKKLVQCSYVGTANIAENFSSSLVVDPYASNDVLVGTSTPAAIFTTAEVNSDNEFAKTAAIAKLVVNGHSGAGTVSMGGYDYHTGERATGNARDRRAGACVGAALEYAARKGKPLMVYVFSDGSVSSNNMVDNSTGGNGLFGWQGDNQSTACSMILVYNPNGRPGMRTNTNQIGWFRPMGDVEASSSPAGNSVLNLVDLVILNYLALHGEEALMPNLFPNSVFATTQMIDRYTAFTSLSTITPPTTTPANPTSCGASGNVAISMNHGHTLMVPVADLNSAVDVTYNIMGAALHNHTVTLTVAQLTALRTGPITVTSSTDTMHNHMITVSCI